MASVLNQHALASPVPAPESGKQAVDLDGSDLREIELVAARAVTGHRNPQIVPRGDAGKIVRKMKPRPETVQGDGVLGFPVPRRLHVKSQVRALHRVHRRLKGQVSAL